MQTAIRITAVIVTLVVLAMPLNVIAQAWSPEQQEVWEVVEEMNQRFTSGDITGGYEFIHPDVVWWNTTNDVPGDYETAKKLDTVFGEHARKWLVNICTPLTIQVFDTFAVVNTYCRGFRETEAGQDPEWQTRRRHFVMKKEGTKWLLVANFFDNTGQR